MITGKIIGEVPKMAEGTPLERVQVVNAARGFKSLLLRLILLYNKYSWEESNKAFNIEPWQMNSNAALKIPEVPRKREAGKKKPERKKAGRKKRRAEGRFRGNSKDRKTVEKTTGPKKTVKPAEGSLQLGGQT